MHINIWGEKSEQFKFFLHEKAKQLRNLMLFNFISLRMKKLRALFIKKQHRVPLKLFMSLLIRHC